MLLSQLQEKQLSNQVRKRVTRLEQKEALAAEGREQLLEEHERLRQHQNKQREFERVRDLVERQRRFRQFETQELKQERDFDDSYFRYYSYEYQEQLDKLRKQRCKELSREYLAAPEERSFATFDGSRGSSIYMPELKQNFLEELLGRNREARLTLAQKVKRTVDENERIFKSSFPSILRLEDHERIQEQKALRQSLEIEEKLRQNDAARLRRKLVLAMECKDQQLAAISQMRCSLRDKNTLGLKDAAPQNLSLSWDRKPFAPEVKAS